MSSDEKSLEAVRIRGLLAVVQQACAAIEWAHAELRHMPEAQGMEANASRAAVLAGLNQSRVELARTEESARHLFNAVAPEDRCSNEHGAALREALLVLWGAFKGEAQLSPAARETLRKTAYVLRLTESRGEEEVSRG